MSLHHRKHRLESNPLPHPSDHRFNSNNDSQSRALRPPKDSRRSSKITSLSTVALADRARYWHTILGDSPHNNSSSTHSHQTPPVQNSPSSSDIIHTPTMSRKRTQSMLSPLDLGTSGRNQKVQHRPRTPRREVPKPFACSFCEKKFERKGHLQCHIDAIHEQRQPYTCNFHNCGKSFSHRSSLCRHIKGVHEKNRAQQATNYSPVASPSHISFHLHATQSQQHS